MRRVMFVAVTAAIVGAAAFACDSFEGSGTPAPPDAAAPSEDAPNVRPDANAADDGATDAGAPVETFARIAAGDQNACAIRNGQLYCWGENVFGSVGQGAEEPCLAPDAGSDAGDAGTCRPVAKLVAGLENQTVV